jgi:general stress protein 26
MESPKTEEVEQDQHVNAVFQKRNRFLSITGTGALIRDRKRVDEVWKPAYKLWFPEGKEDPNLVLLKLVPKHAEYWDETGTKGVRYLLGRFVNTLRKKRPNDDEQNERHAKLELQSSGA